LDNRNNDPYWKVLADHLRKLDVDFYWKSFNIATEKSISRPLPPPRPCIGKGLFLVMKQEHTPPILTGDEEPVSLRNPDHRNLKRNSR
jgi:hypothetical protein